MNEKNEIDFWGCEDDEVLTHTEMDVAIEEELDARNGIDGLPRTLEICGFVRADKPTAESLLDNGLEYLLEYLDDNYGNPEEYTVPTDTMKEAAKVFVQAVLNEYTVWSCSIVKRKTIDVAQWAKDNRPEWLDETKQ